MTLIRRRAGLFLHLNTNKRGVTLDIQTDLGRRILLTLTEWADVLVKNFAPTVQPAVVRRSLAGLYHKRASTDLLGQPTPVACPSGGVPLRRRGPLGSHLGRLGRRVAQALRGYGQPSMMPGRRLRDGPGKTEAAGRAAYLYKGLNGRPRRP